MHACGRRARTRAQVWGARAEGRSSDAYRVAVRTRPATGPWAEAAGDVTLPAAGWSHLVVTHTQPFLSLLVRPRASVYAAAHAHMRSRPDMRAPIRRVCNPYACRYVNGALAFAADLAYPAVTGELPNCAAGVHFVGRLQVQPRMGICIRVCGRAWAYAFAYAGVHARVGVRSAHAGSRASEQHIAMYDDDLPPEAVRDLCVARARANMRFPHEPRRVNVCLYPNAPRFLRGPNFPSLAHRCDTPRMGAAWPPGELQVRAHGDVHSRMSRVTAFCARACGPRPRGACLCERSRARGSGELLFDCGACGTCIFHQTHYDVL